MIITDDIPSVEEDEIIRSICLESFYAFLVEFWDEVVPTPLVLNWHIRVLCNELQRLAERVFRNEPKLHDLIINVPPGTTKSTICSIMFPAWVWTRMRHARILGASYGDMLAMDLSRKQRNLVRSDKYQRVFGGMKMRIDQDTKHYFENQYGGVRQAVGTGGVLGFHFHIILLDDPVNPLEAASEVMLKRANNWIDESLPTRKVDKDVTPIVLIMQRLNKNDPTGHWLEKKEERVRHICFPCDDSWEIKPKKYRRNYRANDGLLDPVRLSRKTIEELTIDLGERAAAGQLGQSPAPPGGELFKVDRIIEDVPPSRMVRLCRYWDKAATKDAGDWCVGLLMGRDMSGRFWVLDVIRGRWDSSRREEIIENTARSDGTEVLIGIEQEPGSGGKESAENTVRRLAGFRCRVNRPTGSKYDRADPFSVQVNRGNVSVVKDAAWWPKYREELCFFNPESKQDDQVDASSGAFLYVHRPTKRLGAYGRPHSEEFVKRYGATAL